MSHSSSIACHDTLSFNIADSRAAEYFLGNYRGKPSFDKDFGDDSVFICFIFYIRIYRNKSDGFFVFTFSHLNEDLSTISLQNNNILKKRPASDRPPVNNQIMYVLCLYVELNVRFYFLAGFAFMQITNNPPREER